MSHAYQNPPQKKKRKVVIRQRSGRLTYKEAMRQLDVAHQAERDLRNRIYELEDRSIMAKRVKESIAAKDKQISKLVDEVEAMRASASLVAPTLEVRDEKIAKLEKAKHDNEAELERIYDCLIERDKTLTALRAPIPMILWCPMCSARHIDVGDFATKPHHTHSCQGCGFTWRQSIVPTVGVQFLPGFKDGDKKADATGIHATGSTWKDVIRAGRWWLSADPSMVAAGVAAMAMTDATASEKKDCG